MLLPQTCDADRQRGFALLIVLWTLVLISFLAAQLAGAARTEGRIAGNLRANAVAQAAADGAIYEAIFRLSDPRSDPRWGLDGASHEIHIGQTGVTLRVESEAMRINPNLASPKLLAALLRVVGEAPERSADLAAAIAEWAGQPTRSRPTTTLADYQAAGLDYLPPRAPFESIDELARVRLMTAPLLAVLRPHLTLFGPAEPDPHPTDAVVAAALASVDQAIAESEPVVPPAPDVLTVRIFASAHGPDSAQASRVAIARIGPRLPRGFALLKWSSGDNE